MPAMTHAQLTDRFLAAIGGLISGDMTLDQAESVMAGLAESAQEARLPFLRPSRVALAARAGRGGETVARAQGVPGQADEESETESEDESSSSSEEESSEFE